MVMPNERRARLSIDVALELRRQITIAAAARDLSVRDYVEALLRQALEAEARGEASSAPLPAVVLVHGMAERSGPALGATAASV